MMLRVVEYRKSFFIFSFIVLLVAVGFAVYNVSIGRGVFNFDTDFSGGTSLQYNLGQDVAVADVEKIIADTTGISSPRIQKILGTDEVAIKIPSITNEQRDEVTAALKADYPVTELLSFADVSSTISGEMKQKALLAILVSCISTLTYISIRFRDVKMGSSAVIALLHDISILIAVYIIFRVPVNNSFIAAVLTILGYSINSTIVVFDRIRENRKFIKRHEQELLINSSITQTLGRTIYTNVTTLFAIVSVYIFGVTSVREFAFPLIIGVAAGAYTSVFFAGSVLYTLTIRDRNKTA